MRKKMVSFVLAIAVVLSVFGSTAYGIRAAEKEISPEEMFRIQKSACEAHEMLLKTFKLEEDGYVYPDDFAGDYIDIDTLHVMSVSKERLKTYKELLKEYDCVKYDLAEYSYNELWNHTESVAEKYTEKCNVIEYEVDIKKNKGAVLVDKKGYKKMKNELNKDDMIEVEIGYEVDDEASISAGSRICNVTLAGSGTYNGYTAFLSCGHKMPVGKDITFGGNKIGSVVVSVDEENKYGDYSIIKAISGYTPTSRVFTSPGNTTKYTGVIYNPAVGTYLYKYGRNSKQAYCVVDKIGVNIKGRRGLTKATLISGTTAGGDSGGPYRSGTDFCGVHRGSSIKSGGNDLYFTPYWTIYNAGFYVKTN